MSYWLGLVIKEIIRIYFSECELGKVRRKTLKVPLFAKRKVCLEKRVTYLESTFYKIQNGTHFNNFWKIRGSSLLREPKLKNKNSLTDTNWMKPYTETTAVFIVVRSLVD